MSLSIITFTIESSKIVRNILERRSQNTYLLLDLPTSRMAAIVSRNEVSQISKTGLRARGDSGCLRLNLDLAISPFAGRVTNISSLARYILSLWVLGGKTDR